MERTQIYLTKEHTDLLDRLARSSGRTRSELIREAIERQFIDVAAEREKMLAIIRETAGAWGERDEEPEAFVESLRSGRRLAEIDDE